jgi:hypothetical protein
LARRRAFNAVPRFGFVVFWCRVFGGFPLTMPRRFT